MGTEIERRWLFVKSVFPLDINLDLYYYEYISQGYITPANYRECSRNLKNVTFRLRRKGSAYYFTRKFGDGKLLARTEHEVQLTQEQFDLMWSMVGEQYLKKRRYHVPLKDTELEMEIDVFDGGILDGIIIVEIEFENEEQAKAFEPPSWLDHEVTEDPRYSNYALAMRGCPDSA